eukprot:scaffold3431_cov157-Skeletonema_dohrnii-CCMP3373.AAC.3
MPTNTLEIAFALPFAPKNGKKYTQWEILSLSAHFAKKVIVRKVQESDYGPSKATIHNWFPNEKDKVFNEDEIRKLLFFDTIGSPDWYTKIEILSNSGFAPPKDVMLAMFGVNTDKRKQEGCVDDARERYLYLFQQQQQQQRDAQQQLPPSPPPPPPTSAKASHHLSTCRPNNKQRRLPQSRPSRRRMILVL